MSDSTERSVKPLLGDLLPDEDETPGERVAMLLVFPPHVSEAAARSFYRDVLAPLVQWDDRPRLAAVETFDPEIVGRDAPVLDFP